MLACSGCGTPSATAPLTTPAAHLAIENPTDYRWTVVVCATSGSETHALSVAPRSVTDITLAGGDYVFEQTLLSTAAVTRRFPSRFERGETYRWTLATLLSTESASAAMSIAGGAP